MKPISEYNFREIINKFVKLKTPDNIKSFVGDQESILVFCYIDSVHGLSFRVLDDDIKASIVLRYDNEYNIEPVDINKIDKIKIQEAQNILDVVNKDTPEILLKLRSAEILDFYRDFRYPDDLLVPTYANLPSNELSTVWMTPIDFEGVFVAKAIEDVGNISKDDRLCIFPTEEGLLAIPYDLYFKILKEETNDIQETQK